MSRYVKGQVKCVIYGDESLLLDLPNIETNHVDRFGCRVVDLKRLNPPESPDEEFQRLERLMVIATEQVERLRPGAEPSKQAELERLRAVASALGAWVDVWEWCGRGSPQGKAAKEAIEAYRADRDIQTAPTLTAEDLREVQRELDAWRAGHPEGLRAMNILDRLDAEGKLGRSGR